MELDGEEGCERNETSLIAYRRIARKTPRRVCCGLCVPSVMDAVYGTLMDAEIMVCDRFYFRSRYSSRYELCVALRILQWEKVCG